MIRTSPKRPTSVFSTAARVLRAKALSRAAGRAEMTRVEPLENRILMAGDHPSFSAFPTASPITLDVNGQGSLAGIIETAGSDDLMRFVSPTARFVKVGAVANRSDPFNVLDSRIEIYTGSSSPTLVFSGSSYNERPDGVTGIPDRLNTDGVVGFIATAGQTYYVRILSDLPGGNGATGAYSVVVDGRDAAADAPIDRTVTVNGVTGLGTAASTISIAGDADVFRFTAPANDFVSLRADTLNVTGSTLDSAVEVYDSVTGAMVAAGGGNGVLTSGNPTDGWAGFVGLAGRGYFVRALASTTLGAGKTATGAFTLRIDAVTTTITNNGNATLGANGTLGAGGSLLGDEIVFRLNTLTGAQFASLFLANATTTTTFSTTQLDTRLEIYDSTGRQLTADSETGFFTNAFAAFRGSPSSTFYIRVRSDEFVDPTPTNGTDQQAYWGAFTLRVTQSATAVTIDPVGRRGTAGGTAGANTTVLFSFISQGSGEAILTLSGAGLPPLADPSLSIYDATGARLAINDDYVGQNSQINITLVGGQTYWVLAEGFDALGPGGFGLAIESNHTFVPFAIDDHANANDFANATPIVFNYTTTPMNNYVPLVPGPTLTDHERVIRGTANGRLHRAGDSDLFSFTPPIDMLSDWAGKQDQNTPPQWQPFKRPGSRISFYVRGEEGYIFNVTATVFDSRGAVVYSNGGAFTGNPPFPEGAIAGASDPSAFSPAMAIPPYPFLPVGASFQTWGGEEYFLQIEGSFEGRYSLVMFVNGVPFPAGDANFDGTPDANDPNLYLAYYDTSTPAGAFFLTEQPQASQFNFAPKINVGASGVGTNQIAPVGRVSLGGGYQRIGLIGGANPGAPGQFNPFFAGSGIFRLEEGGLAGIEHPLDTDLYFFTANFTGFAEIRLNTTDLADWHNEFVTDGEADPANPTVVVNTRKDKVYNSALDGAIRVFSNDFLQIGENNDNPAISGFTDQTTMGDLRDGNGNLRTFTFNRRDPRVVVPVTAGQTFYIQVESGQRAAYQAFLTNRALPVDWRRVVGSYEVLINAIGNVAQPSDPDRDDFPDDGGAGVRQFAAPITVSLARNPDGTPAAGNGTGAITGIINNYVNNPNDDDLFTFTSPVRGTATITLERLVGSTLAGNIRLYDDNYNLLNQAAADLTGRASLSTPVQPGARYFISVFGATGSEGAYRVSLSGMTWTDDFADETQPQNAAQIALRDFQGSGSIAGTLEGPGDTDIFFITAPATAVLNITVAGSGPAMNPFVSVFEMRLSNRSADGFIGAIPVLHRIAFNDDASGASTDAGASFSTTANRTSAGTGLTYANYYIVVRGSDRNANFGSYTVTVTFPPTDDYADQNEWDFAGSLPIDSGTGTGVVDGVMELAADTDLFVFTAPATGSATVTIDRPPGGTSTATPRIRIFERVNGVDTLIATAASGGAPFNPASASFNVVRGASYFALVDSNSGPAGAYRVSIAAPPVDDHANAGEFPLATNIPLSATTGDGSVGSVADASDTPRLSFAGDTDLFTFVTRNAGTVTVTISILLGNLAGTITLFDSVGGQIGAPITAAAIGVPVSITTPNGPINTRYFILVSAGGLPGASATGQYRVDVDGPAAPGGGGGGGDPGTIDFANPVIIPIDALTGYGDRADQIDVSGDRDLFRFTTFTSPGGLPRRVQVQIITPFGSTLDASLVVLSAPNETAVVASDAGGYPGVEADTIFTDAGAQTYYVIVDGAGNGVGSYTIRVLVEPEKHTLFFPEGFASPAIREFVSIGNPSTTQTASYTVIVRYETGENGGVIATGTVAPGSRGGVTLSDGANGAIAGLRINTPYSIIIESNIQLAATLARYDFGSSIGDSFTGETSATHIFPRVERLPGSVFDFIVYYNPNPFDVVVTLQALPNGSAPVSISQVVGANRRFGFNINDIPQFPSGIFPTTLNSQASDPANQSQFRGIVASLSHFNQTFGTGFATLGQAAGSTRGAVNSLTNGANISGELVLFNPSAQPAVVNLTGTYIRTSALPQLNRVINLAPGESRVLAGSQLGLVADQPIGFSFESNVPVSVLGSETQLGDANATQSAQSAGRGFRFGDAFINTVLAGQFYFETLNFHNPSADDSVITVRLLFNDSDVVSVNVNVRARGFAELKLHELPQIIEQRPGLNFFSIETTSATPFTASLTHYDLFLGGGWTTSGVAFGLTTSLASIA